MPKGPQGQRRPGDTHAAAIMVAKIATGELQDTKSDPGAEANRKGGLKGGASRAASLSPERRKQIAQQAAKKRWAAGTGKKIEG
jgi:hypothetical protein